MEEKKTGYYGLREYYVIYKSENVGNKKIKTPMTAFENKLLAEEFFKKVNAVIRDGGEYTLETERKRMELDKNGNAIVDVNGVKFFTPVVRFKADEEQLQEELENN